MLKFSSVVILLAMAIFFWPGCSGQANNPTAPSSSSLIRNSDGKGTVIAGAWQIAISMQTGEVSITQTRQADLALNVLGFLEPPPLTNLAIDFATLVISDPFIHVDVILTHPIPNPIFTGFDVRGVVFGPDLLNADGYTPYMRPDDFTDVPFGYQNGLLGAPDSYANYSGDVYGYKYFTDGLGKDDDLVTFFSNEANLANRGKFSTSASNTRHYDLGWENKTTPLQFTVFNYAAYANYDWPVGDPPITLDEFPITTANTQEAFCAKPSIVDNSLYYFAGAGGGELTLDVELWDWQGFASYEVAVESNDFVSPVPVLHDTTSAGTTSKSLVFTFSGVEGAPDSTADIDIKITATDQSATFGSSWFLNLFPTSNALYDDYVYAVWFTSAPVSPDSPLSFSIVTDAPFTKTGYYGVRYPGIVTLPNGTIDVGHLESRIYNPSDVTYNYFQSTNAGVSWTTPPYGSFGTSGPDTFRDTSTAYDNNGVGYCTANRNGGSLIVRLSNSGGTSGIYTPDSTYGTSLVFNAGGYAIPFGDISNFIQCKVNDLPNSAYSATGAGGGWLWNNIPLRTVVSSPSRLSRVHNVARTTSGAIYLIYFSSTSTDTWVRTSICASGDGINWSAGNAVYDGTPDGYTTVHDPSLFLDASGVFHSAFIAGNSGTDDILYTTSQDGTSWEDPIIAHSAAASALSDPTVKTIQVSGNEVIVVQYAESSGVYLTISWDNGETWLTPVLISSTDIASYPDFDMTVSGAYIHNVWQDGSSAYPQIKCLRAQVVEN